MVRSLLKKYPFKFVSLVYFLGIIFFSYSLKVAESPINRIAGPDMDHSKILNCIWATILVMTTIGYGDIVPRTPQGRLVVFGCAMYGVIVVSLIVVTITNTLEMNDYESKSFIIIERLKIK